MGLCWSSRPIGIPEPPTRDQEAPEGYEFIPYEEYIVAIDFEQEYQKNSNSTGILVKPISWNDSIFI